MSNKLNINKEEIGARLRQARKRLDKSQAIVSENFNISRGIISEWENGHVAPSLKFLVNFSKKYNISLDWLVSGTGDVFVDRQFAGRKAGTSVLELMNVDSKRVKDGASDVPYAAKQKERLFEEIVIALSEDNELLELVVSLIDSKRKIKGYLSEA